MLETPLILFISRQFSTRASERSEWAERARERSERGSGANEWANKRFFFTFRTTVWHGFLERVKRGVLKWRHIATAYKKRNAKVEIKGVRRTRPSGRETHIKGKGRLGRGEYWPNIIGREREREELNIKHTKRIFFSSLISSHLIIYFLYEDLWHDLSDISSTDDELEKMIWFSYEGIMNNCA